MMWGYDGGASWIGMLTMTLVLWGGVAALFVFAIHALGASGRRDQALDTLRRRLASGEITREEFERTRRALHG